MVSLGSNPHTAAASLLPSSVDLACDPAEKLPTARMPVASAGAIAKPRCIVLMYSEPQPVPSQWFLSSASSGGRTVGRWFAQGPMPYTTSQVCNVPAKCPWLHLATPDHTDAVVPMLPGAGMELCGRGEPGSRGTSQHAFTAFVVICCVAPGRRRSMNPA